MFNLFNKKIENSPEFIEIEYLTYSLFSEKSIKSVDFLFRTNYSQEVYTDLISSIKTSNDFLLKSLDFLSKDKGFDLDKSSFCMGVFFVRTTRGNFLVFDLDEPSNPDIIVTVIGFVILDLDEDQISKFPYTENIYKSHN